MSNSGSSSQTIWSAGKATGPTSLPKAGSIDYFTDAHWAVSRSGGGAVPWQRDAPREAGGGAVHQFSPLLVSAEQLELPDYLRREPAVHEDESAVAAATAVEPSTEKRRLPLAAEDDVERLPSPPFSFKCQARGNVVDDGADGVGSSDARRPPPLDHRLASSALSPLHHEDLSTPGAQQHLLVHPAFPRTATATTPLVGPSPMECQTPAAPYEDDHHRSFRTSRSGSEQPFIAALSRPSEVSRCDDEGGCGGGDDAARGFVSIMQAQRSAAGAATLQNNRSGKPGASGSARSGEEDATYFVVSCMTPLAAGDTSASFTAFPCGVERGVAGLGGRLECNSVAKTPVTPLASGISPSISPYSHQDVGTAQSYCGRGHQDFAQHSHTGGLATASSGPVTAVPPLGSLSHLRSAGCGAPMLSGSGGRGSLSTALPVPATPTKGRPPSRVVTPQRFVTPRPSGSTTPRPALEANENPFSQFRGQQAEVAMAELHISALVDQAMSATASDESSVPRFDLALPLRPEMSQDNDLLASVVGVGSGGLVLTRTPRHFPPHAQVAVHNQIRHTSRQLTPQQTPTSQNASSMFPASSSSLSFHERTPSTAAHPTAAHHSHNHHHSARHSRVSSTCTHDASPPQGMRPPLHPIDETGGGGERTSSRALFEFSPMGGDESSSSESTPATIRTPNVLSTTVSATRSYPPSQQSTTVMQHPDADAGRPLLRGPLFGGKDDDDDDDGDDDFHVARPSPPPPPFSTASTETLPPQPLHEPLPTLLFGDDETAKPPVFLPTSDHHVGYDEVEPGDRFRGARFSFLHRDPRIPDDSAQVVVPLHVDVNGTVWLAKHYVDGLPYAVKEIHNKNADTAPYSGATDVSVELQALTIGNSNRSIVEHRAAQHIVRYHTTYVHKPTGTQIIQCEYLPRGNVAEALELHWASATQRVRQVLQAGKATTYDDKARLLRWFIKEVLPEPSEIVTCMTHVLMALDALHKHGIVHGNPIPWNVFLVTNYHYKLGNFGGAARVSRTERPLPRPAHQHQKAEKSAVGMQQDGGDGGRCAAGLGWYPEVGDVARFLPPYPMRGTMTPEQLDVYVFARSTMVLLWTQIRRAAVYWHESMESLSFHRPPLSLPTEVSLEALRASGPQGSGWHLYDERVLACFEAMLCAPSASALLREPQLPQQPSEGPSAVAASSALMFRSPAAQLSALLLRPLNPVTFQLQNAYDREMMKMLTTLEHLKQRREQLQRKVKHHALQRKERAAAGNVDEEGQLIRGASVLSLDNGEPSVKKPRTGEVEKDGESRSDDNEDEQSDPTSPLPINMAAMNATRFPRGRPAPGAVLDESRVSDEPSPSPSSTFFASSSVENTPTLSPMHADAPVGRGSNFDLPSPLLSPPAWHTQLPRPARGPALVELFVSGGILLRNRTAAPEVSPLLPARRSNDLLLPPAAAVTAYHEPQPQRSLVSMFDDVAPLAEVENAEGRAAAAAAAAVPPAAHVSWVQLSSASLCCSDSGDLDSAATAAIQRRRSGLPKSLRTQPRNGYAHSVSLASSMPGPASPHSSSSTFHHVPTAHHHRGHVRHHHHHPRGAPSVSVLPSTTVSAMLAYFHTDRPVGSCCALQSSMMPLTAGMELGSA